MTSNPERRVALVAERARVLDLVQRVEQAETREALTVALSDLGGVLQEHFASELEAGLMAHGAPGPAQHQEILKALDTELTELRAEVDGVWREHRAARDALVRAIQRHEESVVRALS